MRDRRDADVHAARHDSEHRRRRNRIHPEVHRVSVRSRESNRRFVIRRRRRPRPMNGGKPLRKSSSRASSATFRNHRSPERLKITFSPEEGTAKPGTQKDPWNLWVFRTNVGGSFNGEQSNKNRSIRGSASANRTTDDWRLSFAANANYRSEKFQSSDTETFVTVSRNSGGEATIVKSLSQHWSAGLLGNAQSSTFLNYDLRLRIAPGSRTTSFRIPSRPVGC